MKRKNVKFPCKRFFPYIKCEQNKELTRKKEIVSDVTAFPSICSCVVFCQRITPVNSRMSLDCMCNGFLFLAPQQISNKTSQICCNLNALWGWVSSFLMENIYLTNGRFGGLLQ